MLARSSQRQRQALVHSSNTGFLSFTIDGMPLTGRIPNPIEEVLVQCLANKIR